MRRDTELTHSTREVFIELQGGLGNQLFQWAYSYLILEEFPSLGRVVIDARKYRRPGNRSAHLIDLEPERSYITAPRVVSVLWDMTERTFGKKRTSALAAYLPVRAPRRGLLESHDAADMIEQIVACRSLWVRSYLQEPTPLLPYRRKLRSRLVSLIQGSPHFQAGLVDKFSGDDYAAVHVRRGDYLESARNLERIGACSEDYYATAISRLSKDKQLVIVSDDPDWCRRHLAPRFRGRTHISAGSHPLTDLSILMHASELVLSNSTFSWWGAFAGVATKVTAPMPWFNELAGGDQLVLEEWKRVPRDGQFH